MFKFGIALFVSVLTFAGTAHAGIPYGSSQKLDFVYETDIVDNDGEVMSLCILRTKYHAAYLGFYGKQIYVFSPDRCQREEYYDLPAGLLADYQAEGDIPDEFGTKAPFDMAFLMHGFLGWPAIIGLILVGVLFGRKETARQNKVGAIIGSDTKFNIRVSDVLCHTARSSGNVEGKLRTYATMIEGVGQKQLTDDQVREVLELTPPISKKAQFTNLGQGFAGDAKGILFGFAKHMVEQDGPPNSSEIEFIKMLGKGLGVKKRELATVVEQMQANV